MIIITDISKFENLTEKDKEALAKYTNKDKLFVLTPKDVHVPITMLSLMQSLKIAVEFQFLPDNYTEAVRFFYYGLISAKVKGNEEVLVFADEKFDIPGTNIKWIDKLTETKKRVAPQSKQSPKSISKPKEAKEVIKEEIKTELQEVKEKSEEKPELEKITGKYEDKNVLKYLKIGTTEKENFEKAGGVEKWEKCITESSDAEIGYRMVLVINFGRELGEIIWNKTKEKYTEMKEMLAV